MVKTLKPVVIPPEHNTKFHLLRHTKYSATTARVAVCGKIDIESWLLLEKDQEWAIELVDLCDLCRRLQHG